MQLVNIPLDLLTEAPGNPNQMDRAMWERLYRSLKRFGLVQNLVVRPKGDGTYEVLSGNQRLQALRESGADTAPCLVKELADYDAQLLSQALNHIRGEDDLGLRAELLREVLEGIGEEEVLQILPETTESLQAFASLGQQDLAAHLQAWQQAQGARLRHLQVQLTERQMEVVEEALRRMVPRARELHESPNIRGTAVYLLCKFYLENTEDSP